MRRRTITMVVLWLALAPRAHAQLSFDSARTLWNNQQYAAVLKPLVQLRATAEPGELLTIDYMIATSHCRLPGAQQRAYGQRALDALLLYHYRNLSVAQQKHLLDERARCKPAQPASQPPRFVVLTTRKGPARATYNYAGGKQFYNVCGGSAVNFGQIMGEGAIEGTRSQPLYARTQLDQALRGAQDFMRQNMQTSGTAVARDGIVVASVGRHTRAQLDTILTALVRYRDFFVSEYGFALPDTVLHVYLAPSAEDLARLANALHGLPIDKRLIGYSALSDFTMVGIIPRTIYGTLMHELMHLMFREQVAAAPPWLDEGLAALYEVSRVRGGRVVGMPNWRGQILNKLHTRQIDERLDQLPGLDWTAFEGRRGLSSSHNAEDQAINHALARYFVLYLQDKGKLPAVVRAMSTQPAIEYRVAGDTLVVMTTDGARTRALIAQTLGLTPPEVHADFRRWLATVIKQGWVPCRPG